MVTLLVQADGWGGGFPLNLLEHYRVMGSITGIMSDSLLSLTGESAALIYFRLLIYFLV